MVNTIRFTPTRAFVESVWRRLLGVSRHRPNEAMPAVVAEAAPTYWHFVDAKTAGATTLVKVGPAPIAVDVVFEGSSWQHGAVEQGRCTSCVAHPCVHLLVAALHCPSVSESVAAPTVVQETRTLVPYGPPGDLVVNLRQPAGPENNTLPKIEFGWLTTSKTKGTRFQKSKASAERVLECLGSQLRPAMRRLLNQLRAYAIITRECRKKTASEKLWLLKDRVASEAILELFEIDVILYEGQAVDVQRTAVSPELTGGFDKAHGLVLSFKLSTLCDFATTPRIVIADEGGLLRLCDGASALWEIGVKNTPSFFSLDDAAPILATQYAGRSIVDRVESCCFDVHQGLTKSVVSFDTQAFTASFTHHYGPIQVDWESPCHSAALSDDGRVQLAVRHREKEHTLEAELIQYFAAHNMNADDFTEVIDRAKTRWPMVDVRVNGRPPSGGNVATGCSELELVPHITVECREREFTFQCIFKAASSQLAASTVLAAHDAGADVMKLNRSSSAALPLSWLEVYGASLRVLIDLNARFKGAIPISYLLLCPATFLKEAGLALPVGHTEMEASQHVGLIPASFKGELRDYQRVGLSWMKNLHDAKLGGVLADDMGLGKTIQTIAFLSRFASADSFRCLIVAPRSVFRNWAAEIHRFAPQLDVQSYYGSRRTSPSAQGITLTTYGVMQKDEGALSAEPWSTIILDEAQVFKNPASKIAKSLRRLVATSKFALTGTPFENHLDDLWSLFQVVVPGYLGRRSSFRARYQALSAGRHNQQAQRQLAQLRAAMKPFVLRRLKQDVATELPSKSVRDIYLTLNDAQRRFYTAVENRYRRSVGARLRVLGAQRARFTILEALMRLRQVATAPALMTGGERIESTKVNQLIRLADALVPRGHRALVFSQWPAVLRMVREKLNERGFASLYLDGQTKDRSALCERWNEPDGPPFFLLSLKAGGVGLNLTGADVVIHLDPWWNPAVENQAMDRAYRIGQTKNVQVFRFIAENTVESRVVKTQSKKANLFHALFGDDQKHHDELQLDGLSMDPDVDLSAQTSESLTANHSDAGVGYINRTPTPDDGVNLPHVLYDHLVLSGKLTTPVVCMLLDCSAHMARKRLKAWVEQGVLIRRGRRQNTRFILPK